MPPKRSAMSIEGGAGATSTRPVSGSDSQSAKTRARSGSDNDPAASGFLSLLTSLEPAPEVEAPDAGAVPGQEAGAQVSSQVAEAQTRLPDFSSLLLPQDLPPALALLLAKAASVGADGAELASGLTQSGDASRAQGAPGLLVRTPKAGGTLSLSLDGGLTPSAPATDSATLALAPDLTQNVESWLDQSVPSGLVRTPKGGNPGSALGAGASLAQANSLSQSTLGAQAAHDLALSSTLVSSGLGDGFLRQIDRAAPKSSGGPGSSSVDGIWGQQAMQAASRADAPSAMANASMPSLESKVAETVSYWAAQGVQNAALKLDGLGDEPVEVNISLKGREAHISFRTDQPEIRQLLEGALSQLKDLLASEGLLLSGVSVGTSGQDGKGTPDRRARPGVQQLSMPVSEGLPADSHQRISGTAGRAVDIFV